MTRLAISDGAAEDIERLAAFLLETLPLEAIKTAEIIFGGLELLQTHPEIGRPAGDGMRELVISRGRTGYVAAYFYDSEADIVTVTAVRHQRESGYLTS